jgi:hypothetical protein
VKNVSFSVAALFFGGPDDREALAYATRMAEHPGVAITLARFRPTTLLLQPSGEEEDEDEAAVEAFKPKVGGAKDGSVQFEEPEACTREQVPETIESQSGSNVFVVGRMPPTTPLVERPDELGPVGSYLVSPDFRTSASVLVIRRRTPRARGWTPRRGRRPPRRRTCWTRRSGWGYGQRRRLADRDSVAHVRHRVIEMLSLFWAPPSSPAKP